MCSSARPESVHSHGSFATSTRGVAFQDTAFMGCRACARDRCALLSFWRWRSAASASAALSFVAARLAMRCCSGVFGLSTTSCICMQIFMPNTTAKNPWSYLPDINTWHAAEKENCCGNITTETRAASLSCHDAHKLDNGVAGMEDLSGSKDLSKSLSNSDVMVCHLLQTKHTQRHKDD